MKFKKILSVMLGVLLLCSFVTLSVQASEIDRSTTGAATEKASNDPLTSGYYEYEINDDGTVTITLYTGREYEVVIPDSIDGKKVTALGNRAFYGCVRIMDLTIPDGVTSIGEMTFLDCTNIERLNIPDGVTSIGYGAFTNCSHLVDLTVPGSVTDIPYNAFAYCMGLETVTILPGATLIGEAQFRCCVKLRDVTIPVTVTNIKEGAFSDCHSLSDVYFGGTEEQWKNITIETDNDPLLNANIHFNSGTGKPQRKLGDVDGDGKVSAKDSMLIQRYVINLKQLDDVQLFVAEVNGDNKVTAKDALEILRYTINMSNNDKIGQNVDIA